MKKHYIRIDENSFVIDAFSDAFEQPLETDIFIEDGGRHYNLDLYREDGLPKLKYVEGEIVETTDTDFTNELQIIIDKKRMIAIEEELTSLDYKTIKRIQGYYTDEEWQTHLDYCEVLRIEYRGLE